MLPLAFLLNLPWTVMGFFLTILSMPYRASFNTRHLALVFKVKSFWWYRWLPGKARVRAMANGHVVQLGPLEMEKDLEHELIHVEQVIRQPLIKPFLYELETLRHGYRQNKYEREAYDRAGNPYISD